MRITGWLEKEEVAKKYPIFRGYPVKVKNRKVNFDEHFVVPWEMTHDKRKCEIH